MDDRGERRKRIKELSEKYKLRARERAVLRIKEQMSEEIEGFAEKYAFADEKTSERLKKLLDGILPTLPPKTDADKTSARGADTERSVWFCSLCGSEEIFEVFVKGRLSDFLADYDDWYFYGAYMLLVYEDFGGFIYIDDNGNMTEASI